MNTNTAAQIDPSGVPELGIADRLLIARRLTRMDVREFADHISISRSTVSNYENPDYPRARKPLYLKAWAVGCGVSYRWLSTGEHPEAGPETGPDLPSTLRTCTADIYDIRARRAA